MTDASNYGALSEGLKFYVAAMRRFIARTLQEQHGDSDNWFDEQAMPKLPKPMRNSIQRHWAAHQRQQAAGGEDGPEQLLDPSHFRYIINAHWDATYEAVFGERVALHWIGEIAYWRNVWAHAADKADADAERILDTCERVLQHFDVEAADQIKRLRLGLSSTSGGPHSDATTDQPAEPAADPGEGTHASPAKLLPLRIRIDPAAAAARNREEYLADEELQELIREYWRHWRLLDAGEEGLLDPDRAGDTYAELSRQIIVALVSAMIDRSGGWETSGWEDITYHYDAAGIDLAVQITFPEWALPDDQ